MRDARETHKTLSDLTQIKKNKIYGMSDLKNIEKISLSDLRLEQNWRVKRGYADARRWSNA